MTKPLAAVVLAALLLAPTTTQAWVGPAHSAVGSVSTRQNNNKPCRRSVSRFLAVELEPEPEGGTALNPFTSLSGCRMKQLDETVKTTNSENNDPAYKFWMTAQAEVRNKQRWFDWIVFVWFYRVALVMTCRTDPLSYLTNCINHVAIVFYT